MKRNSLILLMIIVLFIVASSCDFNNKNGEDFSNDEKGEIQFNLSRTAVESLNYEEDNSERAEEGYLGRDVSKVIKADNLEGYRVIVEGDDFVYRENHLFSEGEENLNIDLVVPEGDDYRVALLALGPKEDDGYLLTGGGEKDQVTVRGGERKTLRIPMRTFRFFASRDLSTDGPQNEDISIEFIITGPLLSEIVDKDKGLIVEYDQDTTSDLEIDFKQKNEDESDAVVAYDEISYDLIDEEQDAVDIKMNLSIADQLPAGDDYRFAFPGLSGEEEEAFILLEDPSGFLVESQSEVISEESFTLFISEAKNIAGEIIEGDKHVQIDSELEGEIFAEEVNFSQGEAEITLGLEKPGIHKLLIEIEEVHSAELHEVDVLAGNYSILFEVQDAEGEPIEGTTIYIDKYGAGSRRTNEDGEAVFLNLIAADYPYIVYLEDQQVKKGEVTIEEDDDRVKEIIILDEVKGPQAIFIVEDDDGEPIEDAEITLTGEEIDDIAEQTDADGEATFTGLEAGEYEYTVTHEDYEDEEGEIEVEDEDVTEEVTLTEIPTFDIVFIVEDEAEEAIEDAEIELNGETKETDEDGEATFEDVQEGEYVYTVTHGDFEDKENVSINIEGEEISTIDITVELEANDD